MNSRKPLGLVLWCVLSAGPLAAASKVWSPLPGPGGGAVSSLAVDPGNASVLYASSRNDVYKSTNGGTTWTRLSVTSSTPPELAIDPAHPSTVLAGSNRSTDAGATWVPSQGYYYSSGFARVVFASSIPDLVYAVGSSGLWRSTSGGSIWSPLTYISIRSLAVNPADPLTLLLATGAGVFRSTNGGTSLEPAQLAPFAFADVAMTSTGVALAATEQSGMFRSTDAGATWTPSNTGLTSTHLTSVAFQAGSSTIAYAGTDLGLARSTDGGQSWLPVSSFVVGPLGLAPQSATSLYGFGAQGLFRSADGGTTFTGLNDGLGVASVSALLFDPIHGNALLAAGPTGLHRGTSSGGGWSTVLSVAGGPFSILASAGTRLWAGSNGGGVYATTDGGLTWTPKNAGLPSVDVVALAASPASAARALVSLGTSGVFRTTDGGDSWTPVLAASEKVNSLAVSPADPQAVLAGTREPDGTYSEKGRILKSSDGGFTFSLSLSLYAPVLAIAFHPVDPLRAYASTSYYLNGTEDGGASWFSSYLGGYNTFLAIDPTSPLVMYAAGSSSYDRVVKSTDGGHRFYDYSPGMTQTYQSTPTTAAIVLDPTGDHRALYGGSQGLWEIRDGPMQVVSCSPTAGGSAGGTVVTVHGTNLPVAGSVVLGSLYYGASASFTGGDGEQLQVAVPAHAPGIVDLAVTNGTEERATLPASFTYFGSLPTLSSVFPTFATTGTVVRVQGTGFTSATRFSLDNGSYGGAELVADLRSGSEADLVVPTVSSSYLPPRVYDLVATNPGPYVARLPQALRLVEVRPTYGFYTLTPCRAFDSRLPPLVALPPHAALPIAVGCGVPNDAVAIAANVTVTEAQAEGILRVSGDLPVPEPGVISFRPGLTRANNAIIKVAGDYYGTSLHVVNDSDAPVHAIIDVSGYFR